MKRCNDIECRFSRLLDRALCPFAESAKIEYSPDWDTSNPFDKNLYNIVSSFTNFVSKGLKEGPELFVTEIRNKELAENIFNLAGLLNRLLHVLGVHREIVLPYNMADFL